MSQGRISPPEEWTATAIIDLIKAGNLPPWMKSWSMAPESAPRSLLNPDIPYKGLNHMLLSMVADVCGSPFFITPKQLFKLGGKKKDDKQHTWPVFFFTTVVKSEGKGKTKYTKPEEDDKAKRILICKGYKVYNITQTEGIPAEKIPVIAKPETFDHAPIGACERIVKGYVNCPETVHQGQRACYAPSEDRIYMPERNRFVSAEEYYCTRFHEMIHSSGHSSRLNRDAVQHVSFASHAYSQEELVAEFGAAMLCGKAGIAKSIIENSAAYIKSWSRKLNPEMLILGSREARKAFEYVIGESAAEEEAA